MRLLLIPVLLAPLPAAAADFDCTNTIVQVTCGDGACESAARDESTPMEVSRRGNRLSACVGEGCAEGPLLTRRSRAGIDLLFAELRNTAHPGATAEPIAILYDAAAKTALVRWGGFATPLVCGARP